MTSAKLLLLGGILAVCLWQIEAHGKMTDPLNRSSLWRDSRFRRARKNTEDNENFCGGINVQHQKNGGKCGPCGDNYQDAVPRKNENGGIYGRGRIAKRYRSGEKITVVVDLSANHLGHFEFSICELENKRAPETEQCFEKHRLRVLDPSGRVTDKYEVGKTRGLIPVQLLLPEGLKCTRCVLRWHYSAGNNWGVCPDGSGALGCGPQETFRSCSDIAIH